ncbi:hypothetical protein ACVW0J_005804 [Bradyrhizobium sp. i1.7.7]
MPKKPSKSPAGKGPRTPARMPARVAAKRPKATPKAVDKAAPDLSQDRIVRALETIAAHLAAQGKPAVERESFERADAYVWHPDGRLAAVPRVSRVELFLLKGVDRMRDILMENTERFANGLPANNALLWGARGMGKSSLVKAAHASINAERKAADKLKLIEIHREDIESLPALMEQLRASSFYFIVFCDDLSFDGNDASYKSLKAVLEGGIEGRPRERHPVRHFQPPPSAGARDDRERALDRDQSRRSGRGEGLVVRSLRPVARLPPLQPGRISRHGARLLQPFRH